MTSTVSYVPIYQTKVTGILKPSPPLLIPLSEDIFYPFVTAGAAAPSAAVWLVLLAALTALLLQAWATR